MCLSQAPASEVPRLLLCHGEHATVTSRYWEAYRHMARALRIDASLSASLQPHLSAAVAAMDAMRRPTTTTITAVEVRPALPVEAAAQVGVFAADDMAPSAVVVHERAFAVGYHGIGGDGPPPLCVAYAASYRERHARYECDPLRLLAGLASAFHAGIALVMHVVTKWSGYKTQVAGHEAPARLARNANVPADAYDGLRVDLEGRCAPCHYLSQLFKKGPKHPHCHASVAQYACTSRTAEARNAPPLPWLTMSHVELQRHGAHYRRPS
ncbi:uncharacterized protein Tco025E_01701 [Trypanosoma conorhini]|uniref:Uncharacterized protein n=1 Tax=Trypanosoma conorhini TaxID=83891 RepID=A0A3S5IUI6_9TRYP|nr:uncharacterized protein Tco025E_01701 [Trypanosoma conorhini]RNF26072.1 hypothetical protein Tco025E_01701 [Trypanosoma conorhini]